MKRTNETRANIARLTQTYRHGLWMLLVPVIVLAFFAVEQLVPTTGYYISHIPLDDMIPFVPQFVVAYFMWYPLMLLLGVWFIFKDAPAFRRYMWAISIAYLFVLLFCAVFPNGQNLRPAVLPNTFFGNWVAWIYTVDTNTNVLPSLHVVVSSILVFSVFDSKSTRKPAFTVPVTIGCALVAVSTVFIKQHSALDVFAGFITAAVIYAVVYVFIKRRQRD